jgi:hypothetical protein
MGQRRAGACTALVLTVLALAWPSARAPSPSPAPYNGDPATHLQFQLSFADLDHAELTADLYGLEEFKLAYRTAMAAATARTLAEVAIDAITAGKRARRARVGAELVTVAVAASAALRAC